MVEALWSLADLDQLPTFDLHHRRTTIEMLVVQGFAFTENVRWWGERYAARAPFLGQQGQQAIAAQYNELARQWSGLTGGGGGGGGSGGSGGGGGGGGGGGVVSAPTICTRFTQELSLLMRELRSSTVHFVRCLKPNETLTPNAPDHAMLLDQLLFSGMLEACKVMRATFPGRIPFDEVYRRFQGKLPVSIMRMAPSEFIRAVVVAIDIPQGARTGRSVPCRPTYTLVLRRAGGVEGGRKGPLCTTQEAWWPARSAPLRETLAATHSQPLRTAGPCPRGLRDWHVAPLLPHGRGGLPARVAACRPR